MSERDYTAERYNRRTRALEKQATALGRIADALEVSALAATASTTAPTTANNHRAWTPAVGSELMQTLLTRARRLAS